MIKTKHREEIKMKNGKIQIGLIGCGGIANQKHMPSLKRLSNLCDMVAFCDIIPERAQAAAEQYGAEGAAVYTDYRELLKDKDIDLVHVLTPNVAHSQITVDAFEAGKHVMCEKPMSHSSAEAQRMIDAWKKSGKKFTIGYQNRFRQDSQTLKAAVDAGALGDIYFAKAHAVRRKAVPTWGVFPNKELQGGGPLIDIGTHALDLTLWYMDNYKPKTVLGSTFQKLKDKPDGNMFGPWDPATFQTEDSAFGLIKMENGATIFLEASWALNVENNKEAATTLCGTEGGAEMIPHGLGADYELHFNTAKFGRLIDEKAKLDAGAVAFFDGESGGQPQDIEAYQWLHCILDDTEPLVKPEQALVVTQILEAIYKSAETGKAVEF
jgi:predicted dehydrogenase